MTASNERLTFVLAATTATLMIAHQVAAKTARDSLFLSHFDVTWLPPMTIAAAVASGVAVLTMAGMLSRFGPANLIPRMYAASSLLFALQWLLMPLLPAAMTVLLFLHISVLGSILISGFWSIINERYDPFRGKQAIARFAAAATLGGLLGGLAASGVAAIADARAILLLLALLHLVCALSLGYVARGTPHSRPPQPEPLKALLVEPLRRSRLIRYMALLVVLVAANAAVLDYLLKSAAAASFEEQEQLVNFFSTYYVAVGLGGFLLQGLLGKRILGWLGIGGAMAALPVMVMTGGLVAFAVRHLAVITAVRAAAAIAYNSLFRSGFESLYTPVPPRDKRSGKVLIDVGADRFGDTLGSLIVMGLLALPFASDSLLLGAAGILSALILATILILNRGYVAQLARNLRSGEQRLEEITATDATTLHTIAMTRTAIDREALLNEIARLRRTDSADPSDVVVPSGEGADPIVQATIALRSGDKDRIAAVLDQGSVSISLLPHLIPLLSEQDLVRRVLRVITPMASSAPGQLVDALHEHRFSNLVRRRLPIVLSRAESSIAVAGLVACLQDEDLDVARRCAQALHRMRDRFPGLAIPEGQVSAALEYFLRVDVAPSDRGAELRHLFDLLGILHGPETLDLCYEALSGTDQISRGTSLEYLDNLLTDEIGRLLWRRIASPTGAKGPKRSLHEIARELRRALPGRGRRRGPGTEQDVTIE